MSSAKIELGGENFVLRGAFTANIISFLTSRALEMKMPGESLGQLDQFTLSTVATFAHFVRLSSFSHDS